MKKHKKHILFISAMPEEMTLLAERFLRQKTLVRSRCYTVEDQATVLSFYVCGVGNKVLHKTQEKIIEYVRRADIIFHIGVCGALDETLAVGDTVVSSHVATHDAEPIKLSELPVMFKKCVQGMYITVDALAGRNEKEELKIKYPQAQCVDMEAYWIAQMVLKENPNLYIIKSISDKYTMTLPSEEFLIRYYREKRILKSVKAFMRHPVQYMRLLFFRGHLRRAFYANSNFIFDLLKELT